MTDWTTPGDVPADTVDRLHRWLLQEGNPADAATPGERAVADIIRAFWPAPAPTLAEELRGIREWVDWEACAGFDEIVARAEKIEQERDEARAEVERLKRDLAEAYKARDSRDDEVYSLRAKVGRLTDERDRLEAAQRVITNPDELDTLAEGVVIATATGIARVRQSWYWLPVEGAGPRVISAGVSLPVTVLWEPGA